MSDLLIQIGLILGVAAVLALVGRLIKQPPIIAYLITGILAGPLFFDLIKSPDIFQSLAHLGVALLLFIVGISLDFKVLKQVGGISLIGGIATMGIVSSITFLISKAMGFATISSLYLAVAFSFSSTVVVVKLLSDKKEIDTLHGRIALGILIVEDFVAAIALMLIPVLNGGSSSIIAVQMGKAIVLFAGVILVGHYVFPKVLSTAAKNQETLFLFSISWALIIATLFSLFGFSIEIGALLAGIAISSNKYSLEIKGKIKGIRDFFVVLFFVFFGSQLMGPISLSLLGKATIISAFILIGKPIIVMAFMKFFGYKKRTNFLAGSSLAQVSEFSLVLILLGFNLGHISQEIFSISILVALITIGISSYTIFYSHSIYKGLSGALGIFEGNKRDLGTARKNQEFDIILFGYNRIGFNLLKAFNRSRKKYVVIDYNPVTILDLSRKGINCIYGDANDSEFLDSLQLGKAKVVISTIPELEVNLNILNNLGNKNITFIPTAHQIESALKLYESGADYVIMPHFLGGEFIANLLVRDNFNKNIIKKEGKTQIKDLQERIKEGHSHPTKDFHGT